LTAERRGCVREHDAASEACTLDSGCDTGHSGAEHANIRIDGCCAVMSAPADYCFDRLRHARFVPGAADRLRQ
jgi:hypothetical protein